MRSISQRRGTGGEMVPRPSRSSNGIVPNSLKGLSSYLRIVSSGASTVVSTVRSAASAASAMVEKDNENCRDQVCWAGFDKLELERGTTRQMLLLGFSYGFQVWDVEDSDNVVNLVSRHDGPVSFMQMVPKPVMSPNQSEVNKFADSHPLLVICADGSLYGDIELHKASDNGSIQRTGGQASGRYIPNVVWFYSLKSRSYIHLLRFRSVVHLVRCSGRLVAVLESDKIHCFNAATLESEYTILTNPVATGSDGTVNIGCGPLALGPRWIAYSGSRVSTSDSWRVSPQHLTSSASFPSSGGLVSHLAKESSKQLFAGIVMLGDIGYKKLSRYYSELLPDGNNCQAGASRAKVHGTYNEHLLDPDRVGMVIVRDIVNKNVIAQFQAHKSHIQSLCFDPSGVLLVTASVQGHNINVFRITPASPGSTSEPYVQLYTLQRGFTNAVIQDITFSSDSQWIMISSSRGTSHLFSISPFGNCVDFQPTDPNFNARSAKVLTEHVMSKSRSPITLSAVSRIRNGNNRLRNIVNSAASAATGRVSSLSGAIASVFHNCKGKDSYEDDISGLMRNYYLLVFSPLCSMLQYALRTCPTDDAMEANESSLVDSDMRVTVEPTRKWNICQKKHFMKREYNIAMYSDSESTDSSKVHPEKMELESNVGFSKSAKEKINADESLHLITCISEAEICAQSKPNPFWSKLEINYYTVKTEERDWMGEIEVENVCNRILDERSRNMVPFNDYYPTPIYQTQSCSGSVTNGGMMVNESNESLEEEEERGHDGLHSNANTNNDRIDSSCSGSATNGGMMVNESNESLEEEEERGHDGLHSNANTNDDHINSTWLETVNTGNNILDGGMVNFAEGYREG